MATDFAVRGIKNIANSVMDMWLKTHLPSYSQRKNNNTKKRFYPEFLEDQIEMISVNHTD